MDLRAYLIHHAEIKRIQARTEDALGNPLPTGEVTAYSGWCRLVEERERVTDAGTGQVTFVTSFKLILPPGANVRERDRVHSVKLKDGQVLTGTFTVNSMVTRRFRSYEHHQVAVLEKVT
jgi:hypothetical protein